MRTEGVFTRIRKRPVAMAAAGALVVSGVVIASGVSAAPNAGPYEIIAATGVSMIDAGAVEFDDPEGASKELGPLNGSATKLGVIHDAIPPMLEETNPNPSVDLRRIWLDSDSDPQTGDQWLYFAWERDSKNGTGVIMYEFQQAAPGDCDYSGLASSDPAVVAATKAALIAGCNPWSARAADDFILVWDQQGGTIDIRKRSFLDPGFEAAPGSSLASARAVTSTDGFFGEAAINITDDILGGEQRCLSIANVIPGTVTGNSDTADYKDTVFADISDSVTISNCGTVTITKIAEGDAGTQAFGYTLNRSGGGAIRYAVDGYTGDELTEATPPDPFADGETDTVTDLIGGTDYVLTEDDLTNTPYELDKIECVIDKEAPTPDIIMDGDPIQVVPGETTACTIYNKLRPGTLIVNKTVVNGYGRSKTASQFTFSVSPAQEFTFPTAFTEVAGTDGLSGHNTFTVPAGTYDVTETADLLYSTTYDNCNDVIVPAGGSATCTITNTALQNAPGVGNTVQSWFLKDSFTLGGILPGADNQNSATVTFTLWDTATLVPDTADEYECTVQVGSSVVVPVDAEDYSPDGSTLVKLEVDMETAEGEAARGVLVEASGDYYWTADYSGDDWNAGSVTPCGAEKTVIKALDQKVVNAGPPVEYRNDFK